jgi:hypothetical protein
MNKALPTLMALVLTLGAVVAPLPAQAQFGIFFGDEERDFLLGPMLCLDERQVRQSVEAQGYSDVFLNVPYDEHIQVRATRDGWVYLLDYNYCTAEIESVERLRPAQ